MSSSNAFSMRTAAVAVMAVVHRLRQRLRRHQPLPQVLQPLLAQARRHQHPQQAVMLESLAASWLAEPQRLLVRQALQERQLHLHSNPQPSRKSSSSRTKTARRTGKRRR